MSTEQALPFNGKCWVRGSLRVELYLGDCLKIAPLLTGIDAVVSDPPYGMKLNTDNRRFTGGRVARRGKTVGTGGGRRIDGDDKPFDPTPWLFYPAVALFGANHFGARLPVGTTLVWLKRNDGAFGTFLSDGEIAWVKGGHGVYVKRDLSMNGGGARRVHPCQKPVPIMAWCMKRAKVRPGGTVLDPYMGSGSTGIACLRTGRSFVGIERDPVHFAAAAARFRLELTQNSTSKIHEKPDHPQSPARRQAPPSLPRPVRCAVRR